MAYRQVVIQCINNQGDIFTHVTVNVIWLFQKFRSLVYQIGREKLVKESSAVSVVKFFETIGEKAESRADINPSSSPLLQKSSRFDYCVSGGNHIVDENHILAFQIGPQKFISRDGVTSVYPSGIIQPFVIHSHIHTKDVGQIDGASHASLIRTDDHKVLVVNAEPVFVIQKRLDELVRWLNSFKAMEGSGILYTGIVSVKGDNVFNAHAGKLLQGCCAVQGLTAHTFALTALVQIGHNDVDPAGFSADSADNALEILEVIVRRHQVGKAADAVSKAVIAHIYHQIDIVSPDGFRDNRFALS